MSCLPAAPNSGRYEATGRLQLQRAPLDLLHGEQRGEQLRHRGQVEDRVLGHGDLLVGRELDAGVGLLVVRLIAHRRADGPVQGHGAAAAGEQHGARVPGVLGGGAEERLGVGDQLTQMGGERGRRVRGSRGAGWGARSRDAATAAGPAGKGATARAPPKARALRPSCAARASRAARRRRPPRRPSWANLPLPESIFRESPCAVKLSCQVCGVSTGRAGPPLWREI